MDMHKIEKGAALILDGLGADRRYDRNYQGTPERYAKALAEMFEPPETEWATFPETYNDFILLRDHKIWSLCPHHLFPVKMFVSLAYVPVKEVLGLSKLARLAMDCNRMPVLQEAFTEDVVERLTDVLHGEVGGVACLVEGHHGCTEIRGVRSDAHFLTYKFSGKFEKEPRLQDRFLALCRTPGR